MGASQGCSRVAYRSTHTSSRRRPRHRLYPPPQRIPFISHAFRAVFSSEEATPKIVGIRKQSPIKENCRAHAGLSPNNHCYAHDEGATNSDEQLRSV